MLTELAQNIINGLGGLLDTVSSALPLSPFSHLSQLPIDNNILAFVAWLVPFPQIVALLEAWGAAVLAYYLVSIVMRWSKAIQ